MESPHQGSKIQAVAGAGTQTRMRMLKRSYWPRLNPATGNLRCELFWDVIILARDAGMKNGRELSRIRTENLDWNNRIIFVPYSKTLDGRRIIPMSDRAYQVPRIRAAGKAGGWLFPSPRSRCGHLTDLGKQFRIARRKAQLPEDLVLYCARHDYGRQKS